MNTAARQLFTLTTLFAFAAAGCTLMGRRNGDGFQRIPRDESLQPLPPGNGGNIEFIGGRAFTPEEMRTALADSIREINERGLSKPRADDAAYFLAVHYRKHGFSEVEVDYEIRGSRLLLRIREGPRTYLREVRFVGNRLIDDKTLLEYMVGGTRERMVAEPNSIPFVRGDVEAGAARVRGLYEVEGFLDALIEEPVTNISRDRTRADVTLTIKEGQRYTFGDVTFVGSTIFPRAELVKGLGESLAEPYMTQRVNAMERNLQFFYKSRGYFQAAVTAESYPKRAVRGRVPVKFTVEPHALFRFNGVTVRGTDRLRADFIPKRFAALKGDVYSPERLDEKHRELLRTGLFKNLRLESVPQPDNTLRLDLTVEEAMAKEVGFSIGFSSYEGPIVGTRLGDRNFRGNGRPLTFSLEVSARGMRGELLYVDPWWFESDFALRAKLFAIGREEEGYTRRAFGFRGDVTRKLTKQIEFGAFLQLQNVEVTESLIEPPSLIGPPSYQLASVGITQAFDFRDNPVNPSRGWIVNTALDFDALAGDLAFGRATVRASYYRPITEKVLLALGARGGLIYPLADVPIDERYFNGGATTVRSFRERQLGPKDENGYPVGGQAFTTFNAEVIFPLFGELQGAVFADAGNLVATFEEAGFSDMRYGIGVGLRYKLPIGPLRLDVAANPSRRKDESIGAIHFTFGFAF